MKVASFLSKKGFTVALSCVVIVAWLAVEWGRDPVVVDAPPKAPAPEERRTETSDQKALSPGAAPADGTAKLASHEEPKSESPARQVASPEVEEEGARELREVRELAAQDAKAALAWVEQIPERGPRMRALLEVCPLLSRKDPATAMDAAWRLELGKSPADVTERAALENVARKWAKADLSAAVAWASQQPADEDGRRDRVLKGMACIQADAVPADGARLVVEQMSPSPAQSEAALAVLDKWAARDLAGARAWVAQFPPGSLRTAAVDKLDRVANPQNFDDMLTKDSPNR